MALLRVKILYSLFQESHQFGVRYSIQAASSVAEIKTTKRLWEGLVEDNELADEEMLIKDQTKRCK